MGSLIDGGFSMERHALRDDQFSRIEILLPGRPGTVGRNSELGNRLFVDAVIWKFRSGVPWRDFAAGAIRTDASRAGLRAAFGRFFSRHWSMIPTPNTRRSTRPS